MNDTFLDKVRDMQEELTSIQQDIHAHPEMAMEEVRTQSLVADKLKEWSLTVTEGVGRFRVVGTLKSLKTGDILSIMKNIRNEQSKLRTSRSWRNKCR